MDMSINSDNFLVCVHVYLCVIQKCKCERIYRYMISLVQVNEYIQKYTYVYKNNNMHEYTIKSLCQYKCVHAVFIF